MKKKKTNVQESYKGTTGNSVDRLSKGNGWKDKRGTRLSCPQKKPFYGEFWVVGAWWLSIQLGSTSAALPKLTRKPQKKEAPVCEALKKPQTQNWQRVEVLPEGFCKPFGAGFYALS